MWLVRNMRMIPGKKIPWTLKTISWKWLVKNLRMTPGKKTQWISYEFSFFKTPFRLIKQTFCVYDGGHFNLIIDPRSFGSSYIVSTVWPDVTHVFFLNFTNNVSKQYLKYVSSQPCFCRSSAIFFYKYHF